MPPRPTGSGGSPEYVVLAGTSTAHVAQHAAWATAERAQPPTWATASHDVNCAYHSPIFAVSSATRCAGASTHPTPGPLTVPKPAHGAIERRAMMMRRCMNLLQTGG